MVKEEGWAAPLPLQTADAPALVKNPYPHRADSLVREPRRKEVLHW